jgi:hypothetical protein
MALSYELSVIANPWFWNVAHYMEGACSLQARMAASRKFTGEFSAAPLILVVYADDSFALQSWRCGPGRDGR